MNIIHSKHHNIDIYNIKKNSFSSYYDKNTYT